MHGRNRIGSPYTKSIIQMTHLGKQEIVTVMVALEMKSNAISIRYDRLKQTSVIIDRYGKISLLHQCWLHPALDFLVFSSYYKPLTAALAGSLQPGLGQLSILHRTRNRRWES